MGLGSAPGDRPGVVGESPIRRRSSDPRRPRAVRVWPRGQGRSVALSQTLAEAAGWAGSAPILHFVNLRETEAEREQLVLLAHRPAAGKAEALTQAQHRFKPLDGPPGRVEGLKAAHPRHGPLDPEVVALDPLL